MKKQAGQLMESSVNLNENTVDSQGRGVENTLHSQAIGVRASRGSRFIAALLDWVILAATQVPYAVVMSIANELEFSGGGSNNVVNGITVVALTLAAIGLGLWLWLTVVSVKRNGQSLGKRLLGIKVVLRNGSRATLGRIFWLRNVVSALIGCVPLFLMVATAEWLMRAYSGEALGSLVLIGLLYLVIDMIFIFGRSGRCLHDIIAGTIVIKA